MDMHALNARQKAVVVLMDVLLLVELTLTIYFSHKTDDAMTLTFLKIYVPLCLVTIFGCRYLIRRLGSNPAPTESSDGRVEA